MSIGQMGPFDQQSRILRDLRFAATSNRGQFHTRGSIEGFRILFSVFFLEQGDFDPAIRLFVFRR